MTYQYLGTYGGKSVYYSSDGNRYVLTNVAGCAFSPFDTNLSITQNRYVKAYERFQSKHIPFPAYNNPEYVTYSSTSYLAKNVVLTLDTVNSQAYFYTNTYVDGTIFKTDGATEAQFESYPYFDVYVGISSRESDQYYLGFRFQNPTSLRYTNIVYFQVFPYTTSTSFVPGDDFTYGFLSFTGVRTGTRETEAALTQANYTNTSGSGVLYISSTDPLNYGANSELIEFLSIACRYISGGTFELYEPSVVIDIKNRSGNKTLATSEKCYDINYITLSAKNADGTYTLRMQSVFDDFYSVTFTPNTSDTLEFQGLGLKAWGSEILIKPNSTATVEWSSNITLYEVLGTVEENWSYTDPVEVDLYNCTADETRVDKSSYITSYGTLEGTFREHQDVTHPSIIFSSTSRPTFNYVYISAFQRYYFVDRIINLNDGMWQADLSVDVLMTFRSAITSCTGFIDRNENNYNEFIVDNQIPLKQGETITTTFVDNGVLANQNYTFIMQGILLQPESSSSQSSTDENIAVTNDTGDDTANDETH